MKVISESNKTFLRNAIINKNKRIDLRSDRQHRELRLVFGKQFGTCFVRLGHTIVFTTVTAEIVEPKITRPHEGILDLSLDLSSASEKWLDTYQRSLPPEGIRVFRFLERTIKDSRCLDTESLCLIPGEKVWKVKCHNSCLNFDGNLLEATSIATIAALSHFKRPDVTVTDEKLLKVHDFDEKNPLNLTLLHFPFCISFAFFVDETNDKFVTICDPNQNEEESADSLLIIAANTYHEIVGLHCWGQPVIDSDKVVNCSRMAIERSKHLTEVVKEMLSNDCENRIKSEETIGFTNAICTGIMSSIEMPLLNLLDVIKLNPIEEDEPMEEKVEKEVTQNVYLYGRGIAGVGEGGKTQWQFSTPMGDSDESNDEIFTEEDIKKQKETKTGDNSEEEDIMIVGSIGFDKR